MVKLSKAARLRADTLFDTALEVYVQATRDYQRALVLYMQIVGVEEAQPKLDEALNRIGHVESRIIESQREGIS
jgi:hypothetical protein